MRTPLVLLDERVALLLDWRMPLLLLEEEDARTVPDEEGETVFVERDARVPVLALVDTELLLLDVLARSPLSLCADADARPVLDVEAVVEFALDARDVLGALDDARVLALPNVRAAADSRASLAVRDARVPSIDGADVLRDALVRAAGVGPALVRAVALRVSRCSWRALVALLPRMDARAVNERSGWLCAQSLRMIRSAWWLLRRVVIPGRGTRA